MVTGPVSRHPRSTNATVPYAEGALINPEHSAAVLLAHLAGDDTGTIWDVGTAPVGA
jgi:hypothetical protein